MATPVNRARRANIWVYIVAIVIWIIIWIFIGMPFNLILLIPPIIFIINWWLSPVIVDNIEVDNDPELSSGALISFAVLVTAVMFNWKKGVEDKSRFLKPLTAAFLLMMLSLIDISVDAKYGKYFRQLSGAFQTMAVTLITYSLYMYYTSTPEDEDQLKIQTVSKCYPQADKTVICEKYSVPENEQVVVDADV